ncbi:MAG: hypothetical protein ACK4NA_09360 [Alphaproteobacteria bacterium]
MERIRELAWLSVGRACGFALLAIFTVMIALSFDPALAARSGAVLFLISAVALRLLARLAPTRNPRRTEVWYMLDPREQPSGLGAQRVIGAVLADVYRRFAGWALAAGLGCWGLGFGLSALQA